MYQSLIWIIKKAPILLILMINTLQSYGSSKPANMYDEIWHVYKKALLFKEKNNDSVLYYLDSCYAYPEVNKAPKLKSKCDLLYADILRKQSRYNESIYYASSSFPYLTEHNLSKDLAKCYYIIGYCYSELSNYEEASKHLSKALQMYDSLGMIPEYYNTLNNIGTNLFYLSKTDVAKKIFKEIYQYAKQQNDTSFLALCLNNMAVMYSSGDTSLFDSALYFYEKALYLSKKMNDNTAVSNTIMNISTIYSDRKQYSLALKYLHQAEQLNLKTNDITQSIYIYYNLGIIFSEIHLSDSAMYYYDKSERLALQSGYIGLLSNTYLNKADVYQYQGNFKEAYENSQKAHEWKDSIWDRNLSKTIADIELKYENKQKLQQINLKEAQLKEQESRLHVQQVRNFAIAILALMFLTLLIVILWYSQKLKKVNNHLNHKNTIINENNKKLNETIHTRDRLISIIAHDIKNPLATINGFAQLIKNANKQDQEQAKTYAGYILESSSNLFELLENLLTWAQAQKDGIKTSPKPLNVNILINENIHLLEHTAESKNITISNLCDTQTTCFADKQTLHTIIRNIMSNALKFTPENGQIKISCGYDNEWCFIKISDTGMGIKKEDLPKLFDRGSDRNAIGNKKNKGFGLGLLLCDDFIKLNDGYIKVDSKYGSGATFSIYIPKN